MLRRISVRVATSSKDIDFLVFQYIPISSSSPICMSPSHLPHLVFFSSTSPMLLNHQPPPPSPLFPLLSPAIITSIPLPSPLLSPPSTGNQCSRPEQVGTPSNWDLIAITLCRKTKAATKPFFGGFGRSQEFRRAILESLKIKPISRLAVRLDVGRDKEGLDHGDSLSKKRKKKNGKNGWIYV